MLRRMTGRMFKLQRRSAWPLPWRKLPRVRLKRRRFVLVFPLQNWMILAVANRVQRTATRRLQQAVVVAQKVHRAHEYFPCRCDRKKMSGVGWLAAQNRA